MNDEILLEEGQRYELEHVRHGAMRVEVAHLEPGFVGVVLLHDAVIANEGGRRLLAAKSIVGAKSLD